MNCPHCSKTNNQDQHRKASINAENYGGGYFTFECSHCKKLYSVSFYRVVKHDDPVKASKDAFPSFG